VRRALLLLLAATAACSRAPRRPFTLGFLEPLTPDVAAAARGLGLDVAARAAPGAAALSAAVPLPGGGEITADQAHLRYLAARAIAEGACGVYWRLPGVPAGKEYLGYVEEAQAVEREIRELLALRPIFEDGASAPAPFAVPAGLEIRAWDYAGRRYVLLVNASGAPQALDEETLGPWRTLFAVRADAREALGACGAGKCLAPEAVLWLEGRPSSGL